MLFVKLYKRGYAIASTGDFIQQRSHSPNRDYDTPKCYILHNPFFQPLHLDPQPRKKRNGGRGSVRPSSLIFPADPIRPHSEKTWPIGENTDRPFHFCAPLKYHHDLTPSVIQRRIILASTPSKIETSPNGQQKDRCNQPGRSPPK